jgi:hypothetical protein
MNVFFAWLFERFFLFGMRVTAQKAAVDLAETADAARRRGLQSTLESFKYATELENGDEAERETIAEAEQEVIAIFKRATVEQYRVLGRLFEEPTAVADAEQALNAPFVAATSTAMPSPERPKAIEEGRTNGSVSPAQPAKKKRGRPSNEELERRKALDGATRGEGRGPNRVETTEGDRPGPTGH